MFRKLRVLAAMFLVPLVVFVTPSAANASGGPWVGVTVGGIGTLPGTKADCHFSVQQAGAGMPAVNIGSNGYCTGGPDVTPGWTQGGEAGASYTITVSGTSPTGSTCGGNGTGTLGSSTANGTIRVAGSMPGTLISTGAADCSLTEICMSFGEGMNPDGCATVNIPALTADTGPTSSACVHGTPNMKWEWRNVGTNMAGAYKWDLVLMFSVAGAGVSTATWGAAVQGNYGRGPQVVLNSTEVVFKHIEWEAQPWGRPVGVEVYASPDAWNTPPPDDPNAYVVGSSRPTLATSPFAGWTQPEHCRFYFGAPLADDGAASTEDVPFGTGDPGTVVLPPDYPEPVQTAPPPIDSSPIDFSWLWSILDAVRSAIASLASAIAGLASAIVDGITGFLSAAFVPSPGFLQGKWAGVENKWNGTSPGKYLDAASGITTGAVSGCGGLPLNVALPGGVQVDEHIGAACTGPMASAAGVTRAVFTAVFAIGGAIACVRAIGSGLGWDPAIGRGSVT